MSRSKRKPPIFTDRYKDFFIQIMDTKIGFVASIFHGEHFIEGHTFGYLDAAINYSHDVIDRRVAHFAPYIPERR